MVRELGVKWFEMRDKWLVKVFEKVREVWKT